MERKRLSIFSRYSPQYFQVTTYTRVKGSNKETSHNEFCGIREFKVIWNIHLVSVENQMLSST